jgi:hypothetical protein
MGKNKPQSDHVQRRRLVEGQMSVEDAEGNRDSSGDTTSISVDSVSERLPARWGLKNIGDYYVT